MAANDLLTLQCLALGLPEPVCELRFHPPRKWRADCAWPKHRLILECEGGAFINGRHTRGRGYINDLSKYNQMALDGWFLLRFTPQQVENGEAVQAIAQFLQDEKHQGAENAQRLARDVSPGSSGTAR